MNTSTLIVIIIAAIILLVAGGFLGVAFARRQRLRVLRKRFGPEYERTLSELGDEKEVEKVLSARLDHVRSLDIRPLSRDETDRFTHEWRATQVQFVDEPLEAVKRANRLIREVMQAKGYPVDDFEQRAADISVDYAALVDDYRGLHTLAVKGEETELNTEEMRQAMVHGRALFENLLSDTVKKETIEKEKV